MASGFPRVLLLGVKRAILLVPVLCSCREETSLSVSEDAGRKPPPARRSDGGESASSSHPTDSDSGPDGASPIEPAETDAASGAIPTDANAPVACEPVPQSSEVDSRQPPPSGLAFCEDETRFVLDLPATCERIGEDWTQWDAGHPVRCEPHIAHWCSSHMCSPLEGPVEGRCLRLSECTKDADCESGEACVCSGPEWHNYPRCLPAECRSSSDCPSGSCGLSSDACGLPGSTHCHTERDECRFNSDCSGVDEECRFLSSFGHWACAARTICE